MWLGGEDQETRLGRDGPIASVKDKSEALKRQTTSGGEVWAKDLALMDQGNGKEQAKLQSMNQ